MPDSQWERHRTLLNPNKCEFDDLDVEALQPMRTLVQPQLGGHEIHLACAYAWTRLLLTSAKLLSVLGG